MLRAVVVAALGVCGVAQAASPPIRIVGEETEVLDWGSGLEVMFTTEAGWGVFSGARFQGEKVSDSESLRGYQGPTVSSSIKLAYPADQGVRFVAQPGIVSRTYVRAQNAGDTQVGLRTFGADVAVGAEFTIADGDLARLSVPVMAAAGVGAAWGTGLLYPGEPSESYALAPTGFRQVGGAIGIDVLVKPGMSVGCRGHLGFLGVTSNVTDLMERMATPGYRATVTHSGGIAGASTFGVTFHNPRG